MFLQFCDAFCYLFFDTYLRLSDCLSNFRNLLGAHSVHGETVGSIEIPSIHFRGGGGPRKFAEFLFCFSFWFVFGGPGGGFGGPGGGFKTDRASGFVTTANGPEQITFS